MNRCYRIVFNRTLGLFQVASETARARTKSGRTRSPRSRRLALAAAVALALPVLGTAPTFAVTISTPTVGADGGDGSGTSGGTGTGAGAYANGGGNGNANGGGSNGAGAGGSGGAGNPQCGGACGWGGGGGSGGNAATQGYGGGGGGAAGDSFLGSGGGGGGGGAAGYMLSGGDTLDNQSSITGGAGGAGAGGYAGGGGGGGGAGVFAGPNSTINNTGSISGGAGGAGGSGGDFFDSGAAGGGGVGLIVTGGSTINNSGTIAGAGGANAIQLTGGGNTLVLDDGSTITGNVVSSGANDALTLQGSTSNSLDVSRYQGFTTFTKTGTGTWALTGSTSATTGWDVQQGTLSIGAAGALGAVAGGLSLSGGTLLTTASISAAHAIELSGGGILDNGGYNNTFSGVISGTDGLTLNGTGTTTLSGINTYTGGTTVNDGTVSIGSDANLGDSSGDLTLDGGSLHTNADVSSARDIALANGGSIDNGGHDSTFSGVISGTDGLTLNGTGTTTLSGINTYTGGTVVTDGTLSIGSDANLGDSSGDLTLYEATLHTSADISSARDIALASGSTLDNGGHDATFSGVISGTDGLTLSGTGTTTLSGTNTYTGGTTVIGGTLSIASDTSLGDVADDLTLDGGTLLTTASITTVRAIAIDTNGGTLDNGGFTHLISGDITGSGDLTITGDGITILTEDNTHTGTLTIDTDSTVALTDSGNTHSRLVQVDGALDVSGITAGGVSLQDIAGGGTIELGNKALTISDADYHEFSGVIAGIGGSLVLEDGALALSGINSYTGGTTLQGGMLSISDDGNLGDEAGDVTLAGGTLLTSDDISSARNILISAGAGTIDNDGNDNTFSGVISGSQLVLLGTGTTMLSGTNTHTGGTTVIDGTVAIASDDNLGASSGSLALDGGTLLATDELTLSRVIYVGATSMDGAGTGVIDNDGNDLTISGVITGNGELTFRSQNYAETTLAGTTNTFTGDAFVEGFGLILDTGTTFTANLLTVRVDGGFGARTATVGSVNNLGAMGIDVGHTLTVNGDFNTSGSFATNVSSMTSYGQLVVNGTATLGGQLIVTATSGATLADGSLDAIITADTLVGTFAGTTDNSALFDFTPVYEDNKVSLTVAAVQNNGGGDNGGGDNGGGDNGGGDNGGDGGLTQVEAIVAAHGNSPAFGAAQVLGQTFASDPTGALSAQFMPFSTEQQVNDAVSQSLPLLTGNGTLAVQNTLSDINSIIQARLNGQRGLSSGDAFANSQVWVKAFGSRADQNHNGADAGFDADTYGVSVGVDGEIANGHRIGLAFAAAKADIDSDSDVAPQSAEVDIYQLVGYGSYQLSTNGELNYQLGFGQNTTDGKRSLPSFGLVAESDYDSTTTYAGVGYSHTLNLSEQTKLIPSVRIDYSKVEDESYRETGADALNLHVSGNTSEALVLGADGKLEHRLNDRATLQFNVGFGYDLMADRDGLTAVYAGAPSASFVTYGQDVDPWIANGGLGFVYQASDALEITARYDAQTRSRFNNQTASLKALWKF